MTKAIVCDNEESCGEIIRETDTVYELTVEMQAPTPAHDLRDKHFCSLACLAIYAARKCGWKMMRD